MNSREPYFLGSEAVPEAVPEDSSLQLSRGFGRERTSIKYNVERRKLRKILIKKNFEEKIESFVIIPYVE